MSAPSAEAKYKNNLRLVFVAAFTLLALWLAYEVMSILFLFFFAVVLTLILNAPTMWLISKGVPRTGAALIVFFTMLLVLFLLAWLVIPRILDQLSSLIMHLPEYAASLQKQLAGLLKDYPSLQEKIMDDRELQSNLPSAQRIIIGLSRFSFSLIGVVFLLIVFFSIVVYMLINPAPLIETYLRFFPEKNRPKAVNALSKASTMMVGWMRSNLLVGVMEAVASFFFLTFMNVPGVWVWAGLALFAEMVPKLGLYIMAVPPVLVALSIDPFTALWVLIFYLALNEVMGDFVMPKIRASTMNLHPVSTLFVMLAMAAAFGLIGALVATPLTAFIKAYYEAFFLGKTSKSEIQKQVNLILHRKETST